MARADGRRPDPSAADDVASFVHQLRLLKAWSGNPSLDRLRRRSGFPRSTLSDALNPKRTRLPSPELVAGFVRACGGTEPEVTGWAAAWRRVQATVAEERPPTPGGDSQVVPRQLPLDVVAFTGRREELTRLNDLLPVQDRRPTPGVVIASIEGTAGVGKTTLAVHWAHQVADRFPDGQLYVNLRGFDPDGGVLRPADAVRGFLDALHIPPDRIPVSLDAQTGLFRSLLAKRRVLIVLDNARDAEHVRPLLPGAPGCMAIVTSRSRLSGLAATQGADVLALDTLSPDDAYDLLARRLGPDRLTAEPVATGQIIDHCARLPLALAIVAARAAGSPCFGLRTLAAELHTGARLDALTAGDPATDVRTVFSWSYRAQGPDAARLFRLLGLHPGPDIGQAAACGLAGLPAREVRPLLTELVGGHLLTQHEPGRYRLHDLLRVYATELTRHEDNAPQRQAALGRLLDHYLHTAHRAALLLLNLERDPLSAAPPRPAAGPEVFADQDQAMAWFTAEHGVLLAMVEHAAADGFDTHVWQLAWTLTTFLDVRGHWHDLATVQRLALEAAERQSSLPGLAHAHRGLGRAHAQLGRYDNARTHLTRALELFGELGDSAGQALTHVTFGTLYEPRGEYRPALRHAQQALELDLVAGNRAGRAKNLNNIGWLLTRIGDHEAALGYCREAIDLFQELGDRAAESAAWDSLGYAQYQLRDLEAAADCFRHALDLCRGLGDRYIEAEALSHLGDTLDAMGRVAAGRAAWNRALAVLDRLGHPEADRVRDRLRTKH